MERLNYTAQAIDSMLAKIEKDHIGPLNNAQWWDFLTPLCKDLHEAVKFMMPHGGRVIEDLDISANNPLHDAFGLPYEKLVIEFSLDQAPQIDPIIGPEVAVPKRIVYCEYGTVGSLLEKRGLTQNNVKLNAKYYNDKAIYLLPINFVLDDKEWSPNVAAALFREGVRLERGESNTFTSQNIAYLPAGAPLISIWREDGYTRAHAERDVSDEAAAFFQLMYLLDCHNIEIRDDIAPVKLNKKRAKQQKTPLFDYKILTVPHTKKASGTVRKAIDARKSPAPHLRRGHIRHYPTHNRFIQQIMISGAGDLIKKDYKLLY